MQIEFKYPFVLLLFLPAIVILFLYWKQIHYRQSKREGYVILFLRSCVFFLLVLVLAIPQIVLPKNDVPVVFLVDRSASLKSADPLQLEWVENSIKNKREDDSYSVVSFGEKPIVEQLMSKDELRLMQWNGEVVKDHTNYESAINLASGLISSDSGGRIVLLTDGNETLGDGNEAVKLANNRGLELDIVVFQPEQYVDTAIENMNVPPSLYEGEQANIIVTIASNTEQTGVLHLYGNNEKILSKQVAIKEGKNDISLSFQVTHSGFVHDRAELEADQDEYALNNKQEVVTMVKTTPTILLVQNDENEYLIESLQSAGYTVDVSSSQKLPTTLSGYLHYQAIIFNDIAATDITVSQMNLIENSVKDFGVGFMMTGGEQSFGLGGYFKTPIEQLLPVEMDIKGKKEMPSLGLMIVLDRSGSMDGNKLTLAKEAAARSVDLLRESDTLGFIAFDDKPWVIVEPEPLKDKEEVIDKIRSITPGGGTEIFSSLQEAYTKISDLDVKRKHIILLTDGQSATNNDYQTLLEEGNAQNITLSTVAIGNDADTRLLEKLATTALGRYYHVQDSSVILSILSRETVIATRTYIENQPFYPKVLNGYGWDSFFSEGVPEMNAYIATTPKPEAEVPIFSTKEDPILAEWQYGLGRTIAFTSDINGKWAGEWSKWSKWNSFLTKMVANIMPKYDKESYSISYNGMKDQGYLSINGNDLSMLPIEVSIVSDQGEVIETNTNITAPGKYEVSLPSNPGLYYIRIKKTDQNGQVSVFQSGFSIPYSEEYLLTGTNQENLSEMLAISSGMELKKEAEAFRPLKEKVIEKQEMTEGLLLILFFLFFLEVVIRRLGFPTKIWTWHPIIQKRNKQETIRTRSEGIEKGQKPVRKIKKQPSSERKQTKNKQPEPHVSQNENHLEQLLDMKRKKKR